MGCKSSFGTSREIAHSIETMLNVIRAVKGPADGNVDCIKDTSIRSPPVRFHALSKWLKIQRGVWKRHPMRVLYSARRGSSDEQAQRKHAYELLAHVATWIGVGCA